MEAHVQIGTTKYLGHEKNVAVITLEEQIAKPDNRHTILVIDCSQSMTASIGRVRSDSQKFMDELKEKDFVSVIIFSGHKTCKLIVEPTRCTESGRQKINRAIEKNVRVMNTTVFSEPLELALETLKKFTVTNTAHSAVLFTDGCAVPQKWSVVTEENKACNMVSQFNVLGAITNIIGYGVYYDEDFITKLMKRSGNTGIFRHISDIDDFPEAVNEILNVFYHSSSFCANFEFLPKESKIVKLFKVTPEVTTIEKDKIYLTTLHDGKAIFFVELLSPCKNFAIKVDVNGHRVTLNPKTETLSKENEKHYKRVAGAWAFLTGDLKTAEALLRETEDTALADRVSTSFSDREKRETADLLRRVHRDKEFIGAGLKSTGPNLCVVNILREIIEDPENVVFIASEDYERSGELTVDPRIIHSPHGRTLKVVGYGSNESRFNLNLLTLKDVKVKPESGNGPPIDAKIWRTYNPILDGNLRMKKLQATLSEQTFTKFKEARVLAEDGHYEQNRVYTIHLTGIPLIVSSWANPRVIGLVPLLREEADLEAEQTVLNSHIEYFDIEKSEFEGEIYREKGKKVEDREVETYTASCVEIRLMKYKPQTPSNCSQMSYEVAVKRVKEVRHRLRVVRFLIRNIAFAMEAIKSKVIVWGEGKTTSRGSIPKLEQLAHFDGAELKKVSWTGTFICS